MCDRRFDWEPPHDIREWVEPSKSEQTIHNFLRKIQTEIPKQTLSARRPLYVHSTGGPAFVFEGGRRGRSSMTGSWCSEADSTSQFHRNPTMDQKRQRRGQRSFERLPNIERSTGIPYVSFHILYSTGEVFYSFSRFIPFYVSLPFPSRVLLTSSCS